MFTIAGGIILAIVIIFFTLLFLPLIFSSVQTIFSWLLILSAAIAVNYFLVNSFEETLVFLAIVSILLVMLFFYFSKKIKINKKEEKEKLIKNEEIEIEFEKKKTLIEQLEIKIEISKIKHSLGYLLLDAKEDANKNRKKIVNLGDFQIMFIFSFDDKKYELRYKKISEQFFSYLWDHEITKLSINDIFNLNNEIKNFNDKQKQNDINKAINSKILDKSFFEDVKRIETGDATIFLYQHLITEDGIYAYKPTQCIDKIIADILPNLDDLQMNVNVDSEDVARIEISKWNQMRLDGKIEFSSEVNK
jgi:hypothetical protein